MFQSVNSKLSWHDHIVNKVNKAHKMLRLIRRTCGIHANTDVIKKLYINLVRPHLDFASQVWSPHQAYLSNMIEGVQRRATKLMVGSKLSYSDRLLKTGPMSLSSNLVPRVFHPREERPWFRLVTCLPKSGR